MKADLGFVEPVVGSKTEADDIEDASIESEPTPRVNLVPGPNAFHGLGGDVARTLDPLSESSIAATLIQFLTAFGNNIGRSPFVRVGESKHHTNEYVVLVGQSSRSRKGTSWSMVRRLFDEVDPSWTNRRIVER